MNFFETLLPVFLPLIESAKIKAGSEMQKNDNELMNPRKLLRERSRDSFCSITIDLQENGEIEDNYCLLNFRPFDYRILFKM